MIYAVMEEFYIQEEMDMNDNPSKMPSDYISLFKINSDVKESIINMKK